MKPKQFSRGCAKFCNRERYFRSVATGYGKSVMFVVLPLLFVYMCGKLWSHCGLTTLLALFNTAASIWQAARSITSYLFYLKYTQNDTQFYCLTNLCKLQWLIRSKVHTCLVLHRQIWSAKTSHESINSHQKLVILKFFLTVNHTRPS